MTERFNPMISLLRGVRGAIRGKTSRKLEGALLSSTSQKEASTFGVSTRTEAIATLQVHDSGSREVLDSEAPFYELTDVESAMRHEGAIPPGRYAVFRDISGRILLQARGLGPCLRASSSPR